MTVAEMLRKLDSRELTEWACYYKIKNELNKPEKPDTPLDASLKNNLTNYKKPNTMKVK